MIRKSLLQNAVAQIRFFNEGLKFTLEHPRKTSRWIKASTLSENAIVGEVSVIFCTDKFLHSLNVDFLNHSTLTDIITFDNSMEKGVLKGEIYISIQRVRENAQKFETSVDNELHRVIIHGVLHLIGYSDKTKRQKAVMRKKEDSYLSLRS